MSWGLIFEWENNANIGFRVVEMSFVFTRIFYGELFKKSIADKLLP